MSKVLTGLFVGVFVGALAYELLKKTEVAKTTARKVSNGFKSAKKAFSDGYRSTAQPSLTSA